MYPLITNNYYMPVIARMAGYYLNNNFNFNSDIDKNSFIKDCILIGFFDNIYDVKLEIFLSTINNDIHNWLPN